MKYYFFICSITLLLFSCNDSGNKQKPITGKVEPVVTPMLNKDSLLSATGRQILMLLKDKKYDSLAGFFAPADSIHFSPYGFIGSGKQKLTATDFILLLRSNKKINWGSYDGSGEDIVLTVADYLQKFVYNADYLNAEKSAIDKYIGTGNSLNNLKESFADARFIEYHFSGFDKKYNGMDWTSLRLVFKEMDGKYYLIAFVHDQWTI